MRVELTTEDRAMLAGDRGEAAAVAMRIVAGMADTAGADHLLDVTCAHIDGCLYHGRAGLDFALLLQRGGGRVAIPSTLNVSSLDLLHPELVHLDVRTRDDARMLMESYVAMGCRPTWTCAPYQLPVRPGVGEHIAWAESNAIVFANSVLGARTERYGDFIDICCAITGRAPAAGLHLDEERRARVVFDVRTVSDRLLSSQVAHAAIGHIVGELAGSDVPAIVGVPPAPVTTEDHLKALGAAAASSGAVAMVHVVGLTPEAPTLDVATGGHEPARRIPLRTHDLRVARDALSTVGTGAAIGAVSIGTPHCSLAQFDELASLADGRTFTVPFYVNTGRDVLAEVERRGVADTLRRCGATMVTDTCTYITPVIREGGGPVVTDSGKWAWYAPGNLGLDVALAGLEECVRSAVSGRLERDERLWGG
jgi:predicted aconitase